MSEGAFHPFFLALWGAFINSLEYLIPPETVMTKIQRNSSAEDGLYVPFRELGTVTSEHPFEIYLFNDEYFLLAPTKHSYIVYDIQTLNLVFSGMGFSSYS